MATRTPRAYHQCRCSCNSSSFLFSSSRPSISSRSSRPSTPSHPIPSHRLFSTTPLRNATYLPRPKRPWTFDQIVILSDGSTYKQITTSPQGIVRSTKDVRNHPLWNPKSTSLFAVEEDEAGRLRRFRAKYGTMFDTVKTEEATAGEGGESKVASQAEQGDNLLDLLSGSYVAPKVKEKVVETKKDDAEKKGKKGKK